MAERPIASARRNERGVALVMVILVLLVLTVLGITAVVMMSQEDQISARQELQKAAFYAAEAGLRNGEFILQNTLYSNQALTAFVAHVAVASTPATIPMIPVVPPATLPPQWDIAHLGTYLTTVPGGVQELANQEVSQQVTAGVINSVRAYYSLYVRNNPDDTTPGTGLPSPTVNWDTKLRLLAVGFVTDNSGVDNTGSGRVLAVKIMEEELNWLGNPGANFARKEGNTGATSSGFYSGQLSSP